MPCREKQTTCLDYLPAKAPVSPVDREEESDQGQGQFGAACEAPAVVGAGAAWPKRSNPPPNVVLENEGGL
jgi:hypothetical protein